MKFIITESQSLRMGRFITEENIPTETDYLHWKLPKRLIDELGIELWDDGDSAYIEEIHFDTRRVFIMLFRNTDGMEELYDHVPTIPGDFKDSYLIRIDDLPQSVKNFISRRLKYDYAKHL